MKLTSLNLKLFFWYDGPHTHINPKLSKCTYFLARLFFWCTEIVHESETTFLNDGPPYSPKIIKMLLFLSKMIFFGVPNPWVWNIFWTTGLHINPKFSQCYMYCFSRIIIFGVPGPWIWKYFSEWAPYQPSIVGTSFFSFGKWFFGVPTPRILNHFSE